MCVFFLENMLHKQLSSWQFLEAKSIPCDEWTARVWACSSAERGREGSLTCSPPGHLPDYRRGNSKFKVFTISPELHTLQYISGRNVYMRSWFKAAVKCRLAFKMGITPQMAQTNRRTCPHILIRSSTLYYAVNVSCRRPALWRSFSLSWQDGRYLITKLFQVRCPLQITNNI